MIENQARKKGIRKVPFSLNGGERGKNMNPPWVIMDNQEPQTLL